MSSSDSTEPKSPALDDSLASPSGPARDASGRFVATRGPKEAARILLVCKDAVAPETKEQLRLAGVIVVEVKYLSDARLLDIKSSSQPVEELQAGALLLAAAKTVLAWTSDLYAAEFGRNVARAIIGSSAKPAAERGPGSTK